MALQSAAAWKGSSFLPSFPPPPSASEDSCGRTPHPNEEGTDAGGWGWGRHMEKAMGKRLKDEKQLRP